MIIDLQRVENKPIFQCVNCKEFAAHITKVEIKKSKEYGDNTLYFYIDCEKCGCPIYIHQKHKELSAVDKIYIAEPDKVSLSDEEKGIPIMIIMLKEVEE